MLSDRSLYIIGAGLAAITTYFVWQACRSYGAAVVPAFWAGQSHIFFSDEEPFVVFLAIENLSNPSASQRANVLETLDRLAFRSYHNGRERFISLEKEEETVNNIPTKHYSFTITGFGVYLGEEVVRAERANCLAADESDLVMYAIVLEIRTIPEGYTVAEVMHAEYNYDLTDLSQSMTINLPDGCSG